MDLTPSNHIRLMVSTRNSSPFFDSVIIGGGIFGCSLAIHLRKKHEKVIVIEMGDEILGRASYANQARVHNGYHYPRSILTAFRSRVNFPRFVNEYSDSVFTEFEQYYAIGKYFSKVSSSQYRTFMKRIGAEIYPAPKRVRELINPTFVDDIFSVKEYAFDALKLRSRIYTDILSLGVILKVNTKVIKVSSISRGGINVQVEGMKDNNETSYIQSPKVYNCTYSHINQVLRDSNISILPLKHEVTEMALLDLPQELRGIGITVMCGPFFSFMPFPSTSFHTLSHVRYTPHQYWVDHERDYRDTYQHLSQLDKESHSLKMMKDAQRYIPSIGKSKYVDSIWEIKTILPTSEVDDSRPIMIKKDYGIPGLTCILGGKIDNIYDVFSEIDGVEN
jgi:glycine/D-amino acid oxidase-like deaminating enzyme